MMQLFATLFFLIAPLCSPFLFASALEEGQKSFEELLKESQEKADPFLGEFLNMLATLGFILAVAVLAAFFLKRFLQSRQEIANVESLIKIKERRLLSPKSVLYLLEVEERSILVAESAQGLVAVADWKKSFSPSRDFGKLLDEESQV